MSNIELAQRLIHAGEAGNWEPLVNHLAEDVVFKVTMPGGTPMASEIHGKQAVVDHLMNLGNLIEFRPERPTQFFGDGDRVVILGQESFEVKKNGATVTGSNYADVLDFDNGKIVSFLIIQDMSAFVDAYRA